MKPTYGGEDMVQAMQKVSDQRRARQVLTLLKGRIEDADFIGWPLLAQSLRDDLARVEAVARERGFLG